VKAGREDNCFLSTYKDKKRFGRQHSKILALPSKIEAKNKKNV